jgi:dipeptidyl aminopeptidase/acylaminoacyl peptidase
MNFHSIRFSRLWPVVVLAAAFFVGTSASLAWGEQTDEPNRPKVHVDEWLLLGPVPSPLPAFNDENDDNKVGAKDLLSYEQIPILDLKPVKGQTVAMLGRDLAVWNGVAARDGNGVALPAVDKWPTVAYLAAYVDVPRWMKVDLTVRATNPFDVFVDGKSTLKSEKGGQMDAESEKKGDVQLEYGKHLFLVKTVYVPGDSLTDWRFDLNLTAGEGFDAKPDVSLDPKRSMKIGDVIEGPLVSGITVSPDGSLFKMSVTLLTPPDGKRQSWVEIRRVKDGGLVETIRDLSGVGSWQWAPAGHRLSYVVTQEGKGTLRVVDIDGGDIVTVVEGVKDFSGYDWSPDGSFVVYEINKEPKEDKSGAHRMLGLYDKRQNERSQSMLYLASVPGGVTRELTAGEYDTWAYDVQPGGRSVLIGRSYEDLSERPYDNTEVYLLDLQDQGVEKLLEGRWLGSARWSPDGKKILFTGGPSSFGGAGRDVPGDVIPNDYDMQAYLFDPKTKDVEAISKDFDPSVLSVYWPRSSKDIYVVAEDSEFVRLFRYEVEKNKYKEIELPCDVVHRTRDAAEDEPVLVFVGSGSNQPWRVYGVDLKRGKVRTLVEPVAERYRNIEIGKVEDWNFTTGDGTKIVGRIHYPPDFDSGKKWPCIVYYYGGTSPVNRSFGGRYPKNLWAANGYVVYVLQPSGATGFGQEFSARHVNDWGKKTAPEIIEGTKKFLEAHPFVDPKRVGCIGASFGGFMTQLVITETDIFSAAISHAGISSISSYWGEGYWGYGYNAVSAAKSFPWNRPDIYIDQSPLFSADKITTPLLLLHGAADTNVPRGESDQMYVALKLLGKDVEYIRYAEQNHFILDYDKRVAWSNAILAWFDRWLKDEPQWWDDMYPPIDENKGEDKE